MERGEQGAERRVRRQLREGVHVLREALAAVAALAVGTGNVGVRVVDVARKEATRMHLRPVRAHLLAVLLHGVEVRHLVRAEDVVRILRDLRLKGGHHRKPLAGEDPRQERQRRRVALDGEDHRLPPEILDVRTLRQELRHVVDAMDRLSGSLTKILASLLFSSNQALNPHTQKKTTADYTYFDHHPS